MRDDATAYVTDTTAMLRAEAARLRHALGAFPVVVHPSSTHFMLIHCGSGQLMRARLLAQSNVLVRDCASFGLPGSIRVAARTRPENDTLLAAVSRALA
jgi:histidinol-phosphate/aromatic aminotransferase/cobyric acid decarboxylase-like protein